MNPRVIVDHREDKKMIIALAKIGINFEIKQLKVADFIIQTKVFDRVQTVAIERKAQHDFLNSIIDKRLLFQLDILRTNYNVPLLIIEGRENMYSLRNIHPNAIRGMLVTIAVDYQIPIIYTRDYKDTALFIKNISDRLEKPRKPLSLFVRKKPLSLEEQRICMVESLPGIGSTLARDLLKRFGSVKKILLASAEELMTVNKIGKKKAKKIKEIIGE